MSSAIEYKWSAGAMTTSSWQTQALGRRIGAALQGGDVVALVGHLGAGKTQLTKGLSVGLGVSDGKSVNSPTFVLVNEYRGQVTVYHLDAYRLADSGDMEALGFDEMCSCESVVVVEWADRVEKAFDERCLWITIESTGEATRSFRLGTDSEELAARLRAAGLDRPPPTGDNGRDDAEG